MTNAYRHIPVLAAECLEQLKLETKHTFVDATLGGAGHSVLAAAVLGREGLLIGIDQDAAALEAAQTRLLELPPDQRPELQLLHGNFGLLDQLLLEANVPGVDAFLFDLGVSSYQIDTTARGFSFKETAPLDMRMNPGKQTITAAEILNSYNAPDLTRIIRDYSDEKWASRIADFIVEARKTRPFETSDQLVEVVKAAIPARARREGGHPAKRTFQALRIEVNSELDVLEHVLEAAVRWLNPEGRIAVISYHSLEDRIVKNCFSRLSAGCTCPPDLPMCVCGNVPILDVVTKKPIVPSPEEVARNSRARSAKLRVARKCA
ncbi:MAG: 16S rRNA (cytosine(1402)-N(4))-methyltransferase RsmH [Eggerthellaceae bacterium]|nr:16S rRNA (cytosine(1402)-N(4))-methyltransferase RsmH [Eggerthellaceae bacterium]